MSAGRVDLEGSHTVAEWLEGKIPWIVVLVASIPVDYNLGCTSCGPRLWYGALAAESELGTQLDCTVGDRWRGSEEYYYTLAAVDTELTVTGYGQTVVDYKVLVVTQEKQG